MTKNKKIYFISDIHLGFPTASESRQREKLLVNWLDTIKPHTERLFLLGDIFDYWYEYKRVVPRGFVRFLSKIAEFTDSDIPVHLFTGNHDIWVFDYLPDEIGVKVHHQPYIFEHSGKKIYMAHGDGLGKYDKKYRLLKSLFTNKTAQFFYSKLHPNFTIGFAQRWSKHSRASKPPPTFYGADKEWLILYAKELLTKEHFDYFIFGHRHLAINISIAPDSRFIHTGDWLYHYTYAVFDGTKIEINSIKPK